MKKNLIMPNVNKNWLSVTEIQQYDLHKWGLVTSWPDYLENIFSNGPMTVQNLKKIDNAIFNTIFETKKWVVK